MLEVLTIQEHPRALVVDDEEVIRLTATTILKKAGFSVAQAGDGSQALSSLEHFRPDLILMDIMMPEMDGFTACAEIRKRENGKKTPILMMTCLDDVESIDRAYDVGATDFVVKPINLDVLRHRARYLMRASNAVNVVKEYESRYRELFDRVPVGLFRATPDAKLIDVNPAFLKIGGYVDKESCLEIDIREVCVNPEDFSIFMGLLMKQGVVHNFEVQIIRPDGNIRWVDVHGQEVLDDEGKIIYFDGSVQDITERKEAEKVAQERTLLNQVLLDSLPCVALLLRPHTREIVASNKAARDVGAVPGRKCFSSWGQRKDPCSWCLAPVVWEEGVAHHQIVETSEIVWDAHWIPVGQDLYMHFAFDITESKRTEKLLKEKEEQFRQAQKMEAVGRLAGGIAHDFNNFLTAINGYSDLLFSRLNEADPLRFEVEEIRKAGKRAASLTRQLLAFSRKQVLQPKVLNLNTIISNVGNLLKRLIGEDIELETFLAEELGSVKADPGQVEQILMNLAINSRDAMPGGGKLTLETSNLEIKEDYIREKAFVRAGLYVCLAVSDTGCGMDDATKSRLFEPFFTTKEVGKGTGLGLATVYGIVKQSGGYIWCYTEINRGTTFKIYFPRVEEKAEALPRKPNFTMNALRGTETVLVVEDEEAVRQLVSNILEMKGYNVLQASNGAKALELSEHHKGPIHLVVTDIVMPGMTGPEVAKKISEKRSDVKIVFVSGYSDGAIAHQGLLDGDVAYIEKPFGIEILAQKVREVLDS
jgi:PAS domain S-box-containing protein